MNSDERDILADWPKPPIPLEHLEDILWLLGSERHKLAGWVLVPPWMVPIRYHVNEGP
jgi:hypothetical protein